MGRPVGRNLEEEMIVKIKRLFDKVLDSVNKENPNYSFDFEQFVDCFDENDHFTKRVFEFLVKETAQRYRASHPQSQVPQMPRQPVIHHYLQDVNAQNSSSNNTSTNGNISGNHRSPEGGSSGTLFQQLHDLSSSPSSLGTGPAVPSIGNHGNSPGPYHTTAFGALRSLLASQNSRRRHMQRMLSDDHYAQQYRYTANTPTYSNSSITSDFLSAFDPHNNRPFQWISDMRDQHSTDPASDQGAVHTPAPVVRPRPRRALERSNAIVIRPFMRGTERSMEQLGEHGFASFGGAAEALMGAPSPLNETSSSAARTIGPTLTERRLARSGQTREMLRALRAGSQPPSLQHGQSSTTTTTHQAHQGSTSPRFAAHSTPSTPPQVSRPTAEDIQAPQPRYQLHDNGLLLVRSPSNSATVEVRPTDTPASTSNRLAEAYTEFSARTSQERAAIRDSVIAAAEEADSAAAVSPDAHVVSVETASPAGEDHLPGIGLAIPPNSEARSTPSNRRRRTRAEFNGGSPDIASHNSSAIISRATQQFSASDNSSNNHSTTATPTPAGFGNSAVLPPDCTSSSAGTTPGLSTHALSAPVVAGSTSSCLCQGSNSMMNTPVQSGRGSADGSSIETAATATLQAATEDTPAISLQLPESDRTMGVLSEHRDHHCDTRLEPVPPTPPSPNPNVNPMPTFRDRRRSSINPADIAALAQQLQANAEASSALGEALRRHRLQEEEEEEDEDNENGNQGAPQIGPSGDAMGETSREEANTDAHGCSPVAPTTPATDGQGESNSIPSPSVRG